MAELLKACPKAWERDAKAWQARQGNLTLLIKPQLLELLGTVDGAAIRFIFLWYSQGSFSETHGTFSGLSLISGSNFNENPHAR